ncbi:hypothetical protein AGMMS49938_01660 [Fibrobacterales bacterium]|nr:hypothetical protein AGMMS49938_01660 [Fibrobacterales bacterium]
MHCFRGFEFHDISARNFEEVLLPNREVSWSLMIIPFCSDLTPETRQAFAKQIIEWKSQGHKLYLHGYKHKANLTLPRSLFGRIALLLTNDEAEFAGLSKTDTKKNLDLAIAEWKNIFAGGNVEEIFPDGFVAPAWYGSSSLFQVCKELHFENYDSRFWNWNKKTGRQFSIPLSIAGLPKFFAFFVKKLEGRLPLSRIVRHPTDTPPCTAE